MATIRKNRQNRSRGPPVVVRVGAIAIIWLTVMIASALAFQAPLQRTSTRWSNRNGHGRTIDSNNRMHKTIMPNESSFASPSFSIPSPSSSLSTSTSLSASAMSTILGGTLDTIQAFSKSSVSSGSASTLLQTVTEKALSTPPVAYFLTLMAAGFGVPVSEDALCIFAGAVWPTFPKERRLPMLVALYLGVVVSDLVTFWLGRLLRIGLFQPLAEKLQLQDSTLSSSSSSTATTTTTTDPASSSSSKSARVQRIMERAGDYVGFVIRFSVGTRGPLMLLTGFTKRVSFVKFGLGAAAGGLLTLPIQLWAGYAIGHRNPEAVVGVVAGISTFVIGAAICVATVSWTALLVSQAQRLWSKWRNSQNDGTGSDGVTNFFTES